MSMVFRLSRRIAGIRARRRLRMAVELTNYCNFSCTYCPHSTRGRDAPPDVNRFDRPQGFMSDETFALCLENAHKYANSVSISFFGEQMLHPRFDDLIRTVPRQRPYRLITNTNGSLLTEENIETLKLFDIVRFSIDSTDAESFERLRPGGAILTIQGKRGANRYDTLADKIDKSVLSYGGVMKDPYMTENPCTIPEDGRLIVAFNGDCTPCNLDVNVALGIGNIHETPDLRKMVSSRRSRAVMRGIRRNEGICRNCNDANNHQESLLYWGERGTGSAGRTMALTRADAIAYKQRTGRQDLRRAA
jgi:radical SAM protein with 4Fe4S-binding SPASM domain